MSSTSTGPGYTTAPGIGTGSSVHDLIVALAKDQTSNHRQIIERLDKIEHRIATMEQNTHERSIYFQGLVEGVRAAILSKLDARSDTKPLSMGGSE